jgi:hypothetical protein
LGDKPALSPVQSFYQRILASDPDEVAFQAGCLRRYKEVALPALAMAQIDVTRRVMHSDRQVEVCAAVERVVVDLSDRINSDEAVSEAAAPAASDAVDAAGMKEQAAKTETAVLCLAGRTPLDHAACEILVQLLDRRQIATGVAGPRALTTGGIFELNAKTIGAICIFCLDHQSLAAVRYWCAVCG